MNFYFLFLDGFQWYLATHNACASNPCVHGVCVEGLTSFICDCLPGWTGRTCHGIDHRIWRQQSVAFSLEKIGSSCANHQCGNGKCFPINDPSLLYVCLCPTGQLAASCKNHEIRLTTGRMLIAPPPPSSSSSPPLETCDPLKPQSCMNGGQCLPNIDGYQCLCTSGFMGRFCQISRSFRIEIILIMICI